MILFACRQRALSIRWQVSRDFTVSTCQSCHACRDSVEDLTTDAAPAETAEDAASPADASFPDLLTGNLVSLCNTIIESNYSEVLQYRL